MEYRIIWSEFAEYQLDKIYNYYANEVSVNVAKAIMMKIRDGVQVLCKTPLIGEREELLVDRIKEYRRLIVANYKVIYYMCEETGFVKIADVFDTRQNPKKLRRN